MFTALMRAISGTCYASVLHVSDNCSHHRHAFLNRWDTVGLNWAYAFEKIIFRYRFVHNSVVAREIEDEDSGGDGEYDYDTPTDPYLTLTHPYNNSIIHLNVNPIHLNRSHTTNVVNAPNVPHAPPRFDENPNPHQNLADQTQINRLLSPSLLRVAGLWGS
ncbi:hypothetical protein D9758_006947 [Tetrapyrgos nigripes]|uniref:Uncharacterized protein n=1 Tax=Tetrapyrgos nigripes TaxID=182062 RepID=A0A8H5GSW9_9AGAR|nr:hypothetical protein D9758_006947 [Tetrapyrgos nigripes]